MQKREPREQGWECAECGERQYHAGPGEQNFIEEPGRWPHRGFLCDGCCDDLDTRRKLRRKLQVEAAVEILQVMEPADIDKALAEVNHTSKGKSARRRLRRRKRNS